MGTYHARASASPAIPPAMRCVLSGIFSLGATTGGGGDERDEPSSVDLIDMVPEISVGLDVLLDDGWCSW
jgi:hypothetical protein